MTGKTQNELIFTQNFKKYNRENPGSLPQVNVANICNGTQALGPGLRSVVWVQGCPLNCKGCIAPSWIPMREAQLVSPHELADRLLENPDVTGITFSGGEPMLQAEGLAQTARLIRKKRDVNMICFTGYKYETLLQRPPNTGVEGFLGQLDVLIDGPYIQAQNSGIGLRGSDNQRILHLSRRLAGADLEKSPRRMELKLGRDDLVIVGIPPQNTGLSLDQIGSLFQE